LQQDLEEVESQFRQEQEELKKRLQTMESENEQVSVLLCNKRYLTSFSVFVCK